MDFVRKNTLPVLYKNKHGKLKSNVTYLEMFSKPEPFGKWDLSKVEIIRANKPTVSFYRFLYNTVGYPWLWIDRRKISDSALSELISVEGAEIYVMYVDGVPAGYVELDTRNPSDIELNYFGMMPEFFGKNIGGYLLQWAIDKAWSYNPKRFWVNTCSLDHPRALELYLKAGFVKYKEEVKWSDDPWDIGLYPMKDREHYRYVQLEE